MSQTVSTGTRRERRRQATTQEIVEVSRDLLTDPSGLSLRAVAQRMGITAPALYRYVDNYQDLVHLVAGDIDVRTSELIAEARDTQPDTDPAAQIICAAIAFRGWALTHREEFALLFTNPITAHDVDTESMKEEQTGHLFTAVLFRIWLKYQFPIPAVADLDPAVAAMLADPILPAKVDQIPEEARGLLWIFMQLWAALYGTVTLEVFGHCDPRVIESGALFRAMLATQSELLGIAHELPRLLPMIEKEMAP